MTESTKPAQCRDEDWNLARDCGLMGATPGTNAWDAALGRFADGIRTTQPQAGSEMTDAEILDVFEKSTGFTMDSHSSILDADILGFTRAILSRPAPEALGAAKGELSDAEIEEFVTPLIQEHLSGNARHYVTYHDGRTNDRVTSNMRNLARAILAKAKGEQA